VARVGLIQAVESAVSWAVGGDGHASALAELALTLASELMAEGASDKPAPTAQLSKELRATLEELEGLRDGDDAGASLGAVLSSPVWDAQRSS
jgi:hypothetical protein